MNDSIKYLFDEGRIVLQAPVAFATCICIVALAIWIVLSWTFTSQIANLQSRISLRDDQIADYKIKLGGATPDEAKKRLDALELQLKSLTPRRITIDQRQKITTIISHFKASIEILQDIAVADAKALSSDFALAFNDAGWQTNVPGVMGAGGVPPKTGLALRVNDLHNLSPAEVSVKSALEAASIAFDLQMSARRLTPAGGPTPDVSILVTTKLD